MDKDRKAQLKEGSEAGAVNCHSMISRALSHTGSLQGGPPGRCPGLTTHRKYRERVRSPSGHCKMNLIAINVKSDIWLFKTSTVFR